MNQPSPNVFICPDKGLHKNKNKKQTQILKKLNKDLHKSNGVRKKEISSVNKKSLKNVIIERSPKKKPRRKLKSLNRRRRLKNRCNKKKRKRKEKKYCHSLT